MEVATLLIVAKPVARPSILGFSSGNQASFEFHCHCFRISEFDLTSTGTQAYIPEPSDGCFVGGAEVNNLPV